MSESITVKAIKKPREFPDVYVLLFFLCLFAMLLTYIVPAGTFERVREDGVNRVVAGSFHFIERAPQNPWNLLQSIFTGFVNSAPIIFMVFFCGAAINMLEESKSLSTAFCTLARALKGKEFVAIFLVMVGLGLGASAGVFANLAIAIIPIGIFLARAMGGDDFLGFLLIYFGIQSGAAVGFAFPGILGVAQTIAEVPLFSGFLPRFLACITNILFMYTITVLYFRKTKKDPTKSMNYKPGLEPYQYMGDLREGGNVSDGGDLKLTKRQLVIFSIFILSVASVVFLTIQNGWANRQIASWFFGTMIIVAIVSQFSPNEIANKFIKGCQPMIYGSFVIGFANGISVILSNGKILDTIVYYLSMPINAVGPVFGAGFMVVMNAFINLLIPSGSGQAAVVMPVMVPMADITGITRQVAVQAFQFGDGFTNLITPLNGVLMGSLALCGVSYPKYFPFILKIIIVQVVASSIFVMFLQSIGWMGF